MTLVRTDVLTTLHRVPLFSDLSRAETEDLAVSATVRDYKMGAQIFAEGEPCEALHIVESGTVRILRFSAGGREQLIGIEQRGSTLDEVAIFDNSGHFATALAESDVSLVSIRASVFRKFCTQHPDVAAKILRAMSSRLRHLMRLVEELSFSTVRNRLIVHLLRLARESGAAKGKSVRFVLSERNHQLAARLGTVRELVSRNLGHLRANGLIAMSGREVTIPDVAALEAELQEHSLEV